MINLEQQYRNRFDKFLLPMADRLEAHLRESLSGTPRIDRISVRAKAIDRFIQKAGKNDGTVPKYSDPLSQIQDQLAARIVTFYASDVPRISVEVRKYFRPIENKVLVPETEREFGYVGEHFILLIPSDIRVVLEKDADVPDFFELQIKTLFQHAWAEAEHDIGYKPGNDLTQLHRRKMAFTAAQAWGADHIFDELFKELRASEPKHT